MKISVEFANGYTWVADIKQIAVDDAVVCVLDSVHNEVNVLDALKKVLIVPEKWGDNI